MWEQVEAPLVLSVLLYSFCDVGDGETVVQEPLLKGKASHPLLRTQSVWL